MSTVRRRVAALARASARRERLEPELRTALEARRSERLALQAQADDMALRLLELEALALDHRARITRMMTGEEPFSLDAFDGCRRYVDIIDTQRQEAEAALDAQRVLVAAKDDEMSAARREIALNRGRIDVCRKRVHELENLLEQAALEAEDEAAEELVLARRSKA